MYERNIHTNRAFTLIELLIVITILGLIASIILVSLQGARTKGRIAAGQTFNDNIYQNFGSDAIDIWRFDEGSGTSLKNDATSGTETISGSGITWVSGPGISLDKALHFNGDGSGINITATGALSQFTLTAWIYNESGGDSRHSILQNFWEVVGNDICFWSYNFVNQYWRCTTNGPLPYNAWSFVATSWDGSVIRHFVDAKLVWKDTTTTTGSSESFSSIGFGCCGGRQFLGSLGDLRIYSHPLTIGEIQKIYADGRRSYIAARTH